jgi:hypothetical protein
MVAPPQLANAVTHVVIALREGRAESASRGPLAPLAFDAVVVAGGGPVDDVVAALNARAITARPARDPLYVCAAAGAVILREHGKARGVVVDVGQTSIKVAHVGAESRPQARRRVERPTALDASGVAHFVTSLGRSAAVVALPCEIDDDDDGVTLGACTYWPASTPWPRVSGVDVLLINDAELAAASVSLESAPTEHATTLVLTVGFGVGAAIVVTSGASRRGDSTCR